ncbi:hypothetical protein GGQ92_000248 [Gracilibacillus halotolerans]|uniref:DUF503 domain-containing protein n=1 Tax=Gracilibacillus halotolerans TaxID=74386 RepID=A0A841RFV8_9BACI|nr:DUF503 domain-containing protein [Gracilibacillus halotolerans]MBB6511481.1 hypothetical protein [Gracilibacillus halotolerans]
MIIYAEIEIFLYDCHSLKDKRSVLARLRNQLKKDWNIAFAEIDYQDLWQRSKIGIVTISQSLEISRKVIDQIIERIDTFTEVERTLTHIEER